MDILVISEEGAFLLRVRGLATEDFTFFTTGLDRFGQFSRSLDVRFQFLDVNTGLIMKTEFCF